MKRVHIYPRSHRRRGTVAVLTAVTMVVLLLCASLTIDIGYIQVVAGQMQNNADAAALAGGGALQEGFPEAAAHDVALEYIAKNQQTQGFSSLDDQVIELGTWNSVTQTFTPLAESGAPKAFAVRVVSHRTKTPLFFAAIIGKHSTHVYREAVAAGSGPCTGIWALEGIRAGSITTDSYISTDGPYSAVTALENGDLCSGRYIDLNGSFDIHGDVMPGFGYEFNLSGGSGDITGMTTANVNGFIGLTVPPIELPVSNDNDTIGLTNLGKSPWKGAGNIDLQGSNTLTLAPGTYVFNRVTIAGSATIAVVGPTTIYILDRMDVTGGGFVNENMNPHDLTILSTSTDYLRFGGGSAFYGSVLAPTALVKLGGNDEGFFGAIVAKTVEMKGDAFVHVDESLLIASLFDPPAPFLVK